MADHTVTPLQLALSRTPEGRVMVAMVSPPIVAAGQQLQLTVRSWVLSDEEEQQWRAVLGGIHVATAMPAGKGLVLQ